MSSEAFGLLVSGAFIALCLVVFVGLNYAVESWQCKHQWQDSGFHYRYGYASGCMIQRQDRTWIPAQAYREVP